MPGLGQIDFARVDARSDNVFSPGSDDYANNENFAIFAVEYVSTDEIIAYR